MIGISRKILIYIGVLIFSLAFIQYCFSLNSVLIKSAAQLDIVEDEKALIYVAKSHTAEVETGQKKLETQIGVTNGMRSPVKITAKAVNADDDLEVECSAVYILPNQSQLLDISVLSGQEDIGDRSIEMVYLADWERGHAEISGSLVTVVMDVYSE